GALRRLDARGSGEGALHEQRRERAVVLEPVDMQLVLPLDRDVDPGLARVEIEMARAEAEPVAGRDRGEVREHAVLEAEELEGTRILRLAGGRVVAARHHDRG